MVTHCRRLQQLRSFTRTFTGGVSEEDPWDGLAAVFPDLCATLLERSTIRVEETLDYELLEHRVPFHGDSPKLKPWPCLSPLVEEPSHPHSTAGTKTAPLVSQSIGAGGELSAAATGTPSSASLSAWGYLGQKRVLIRTETNYVWTLGDILNGDSAGGSGVLCHLCGLFHSAKALFKGKRDTKVKVVAYTVGFRNFISTKGYFRHVVMSHYLPAFEVNFIVS